MSDEPARQRGDIPAAGRTALAVALADRRGLISHWSTGAHRLFGRGPEQVVHRPAADVLPVSGVLDVVGDADEAGAAYPPEPSAVPEAGADHATSGRFCDTTGGGSGQVAWWAYPLTGPGRARLLLLASDATGLDCETAPDFAPPAALPDAEDLIRRLDGTLPRIRPEDSPADLLAQLLTHGYPVLHRPAVSHPRPRSADRLQGRWHC